MSILRKLKIKNYFYSSDKFDEAEFKISKLIRKHNIKDYAVVSPDSDFIIILLILQA